MRGPARILGHQMHPMLIVFPLGLLATAAICDIGYLFSERPTFALLAYWLIPAGLVGGLLAGVTGLIDWTAIPSGTRAKTVGLWHAAVNVAVLAVFFVSWYLRPDPRSAPGTVPIVLSLVGVLAALPAGWLGGELVERLGIGVHPGANPDAPSSVTTDTAGARESEYEAQTYS
jgi:uncharacterized membrane protein